MQFLFFALANVIMAEEVKIMRLSNIIGMGSGFLMLGIAGVILLGILFGIGYGLIYRKLLGGEKRLKGTQILLAAVCFCYLIVVVGATLLSRGDGYREVCLYPFYSYREAWRSQSAIEWRNLILNIGLFLPWGFLLPLWGGRFRKLFWTVGSGLLASVLIEGIQFVCNRGVVEFDDVFNNTLGTLIGYGLVIVLLELFLKKERHISRIFLGFVPLFLTLGAFGIMRQVYIMQPYGNLACAPSYRINMRKIDVSGKTEWGEEQSTVKVYETTVAKEEEMLDLAQEIFAKFGTDVDEEQTDAYDEMALYYSADSNYSVWIEYKGLAYDWTDYSIFDEDMDRVFHASEQEVRDLLEKLDISVPKEAVFEETVEGQYRFLVSKLQESEDEMLDGVLSLYLYGKDTIGQLNNRIVRYTVCGEEEIISEEEAYQKLLDGKFRYSYQQETPKTLEVKSVSLVYQLDTKGFYQPVYEFDCRIDGEETSIWIPALK